MTNNEYKDLLLKQFEKLDDRSGIPVKKQLSSIFNESSELISTQPQQPPQQYQVNK